MCERKERMVRIICSIRDAGHEFNEEAEEC